MIENETEEIQIELDDETAAIAEVLASERGMTVEELISQILQDAIKEGKLEE